MKMFSGSRPSPAMVVAVFALVFAMVGSAVAGTDGLSEKITKSKVKKIANKQITKRAPGLSVAKAKDADNAKKADTADTATTATTATTAGDAGTLDGIDSAALQQPQARALVERTPAVAFNPAYGTKGFTAVTRPTAGVYCLTPGAGINPASDPLTVTVEWGNSIGFDLLAYWNAGNSPDACPAGRYQVRTYDFAAGGAPVLSNDVSFYAQVIK